MKAAVRSRYGPPEVIRLEEVPQPIPGDDEVLVEIHAASINAADWHLLRGDPFLIRLTSGLGTPKQRILGADIAGRVAAVGSNVREFEPGDEVFGDLSASGFGAFAEFVAVPAQSLLGKPRHLTFEEAAAVPLAAVTALQGLRDKGGISSGQRVLITGASGGVGSFAVQLAKWYGAHVTGVCSGAKTDFVRSLGADEVIDYEKDDFTARPERYDLIFDAGAFRSVFATKRALAPGGTYVMVGGANSPMFQALLVGSAFLAKPKQEDLATVKELVEAGHLRPVVDEVFPLERVAEAISYVEEGKVRGKVVVRVAVDTKLERGPRS